MDNSSLLLKIAIIPSLLIIIERKVQEGKDNSLEIFQTEKVLDN